MNQETIKLIEQSVAERIYEELRKFLSHTRNGEYLYIEDSELRDIFKQFGLGVAVLDAAPGNVIKDAESRVATDILQTLYRVHYGYGEEFEKHIQYFEEKYNVRVNK